MRIKGIESKVRVNGKIETEPHRKGVRGRDRRSRISICLLDLAARLERKHLASSSLWSPLVLNNENRGL